MKELYCWFPTTGIFFKECRILVYEFKDQKIKEYLGDVNYFLEQRNLENMREVEKKDALKASAPKESNKASYEDQKKGKALQNRLSKIESQIKQLEKDIQQDDNNWLPIMTRILKMLLFSWPTIKRKPN